MLKRHKDGERPPLTDPEVLTLLEDEPELLALADAISATQSRGRRRWPMVATLAAALAALAVVLALLVVRNNNPSLVEEALAAVGNRPVIHAVVERPAGDNVVVDLRTGRAAPVIVELESWHDERSDRFRVVTRRQGRIVADVIVRKAFPIGVDRAAATFLSSYRRALESGQAREHGNGLVVTTGGVREQVKLNSARRPQEFASVEQPNAVWRVMLYATGPAREGDFRTARPPVRPIAGQVVSSSRLSLNQALKVLGPRLAERARYAGGALQTVLVQRLASELSDGRTRRGVGFELDYGSPNNFVQLRLARRPEPAYGYVEGRLTYSFNPLPAPERVDLVRPTAGGSSLWLGQAHVAGFYVTVRAPSRQLTVSTVKALR
jgi:hypothetical protein